MTTEQIKQLDLFLEYFTNKDRLRKVLIVFIDELLEESA
jgi:hypothetical protein